MVEQVNHPQHYQMPGGVEVIDLVEHLPFNVGNAIKYLCRAGRKPGVDHLVDLRKAAWYIDREILRVEGGGDASKPSVQEERDQPGGTTDDAVRLLWPAVEQEPRLSTVLSAPTPAVQSGGWYAFGMWPRFKQFVKGCASTRFGGRTPEPHPRTCPCDCHLDWGRFPRSGVPPCPSCGHAVHENIEHGGD